MRRLALRDAALLAVAAWLGVGCSKLYLPDQLEAHGLERAALGLDWRVRISHRSDTFQDFHPEEGGAPTLVEERGVVLVGSRKGRLLCLDAFDGRLLWEHKVYGPIDSRPAVDRRRVFFGTASGNLVALDLDSGEQLWSYGTQGEIGSHPTVAGDLVLFSTNANEIYALDKRTGKWRWHYKQDNPSKMTVRGHASPVVRGEEVYVGFTSGKLVALDVKDGSLLWEKDLAPEKGEFRDVDTTPVVADDRMYVASYEGGVYCLDPADGKMLWRNAEQRGTVGLVSTRGLIWATSARDGLLAMRATDGDVVFRSHPRKWGRPGPPVKYRNLILVNSFEGPLYVFDNHTGELIQAFSTGHGFAAPPAAGSRKVFAVSNGGFIYGFRVGGLGFLDAGIGEQRTRSQMTPILEQHVEPRAVR